MGRAEPVDNVTQIALVTQSVEYIKNTLDNTSKKLDIITDKFDHKIESDLKASVDMAVRMTKLEGQVSLLWKIVLSACGVILLTAWQVWIKGVFKL